MLIALEGIDGAGKTTQARLLVRWLRRAGLRAAYTYEPTRKGAGRIVRQRLREDRGDAYLDALLFAADRRSHYLETIRPLEDSGFIIVSDRFLHSSIAYQGAETGEVDWVRSINKGIPPPDLGIYIDVPVEVGLRRLKHKRVRFERRRGLLRRVRDLYLSLCEGNELVMVDGRGSVEDTQAVLREVVSRHLGASR